MVSSRRGIRAWFRRVLPIAIVVASSAQAANAERKSVSLSDGWEFRQRIEQPGGVQPPWHPAEVPGVVHTDLLRNKLMPDPFYRSNESTLQWIEDADWEYRSTLQATPEALKHSHVELVFGGLDGPAEVYLDGKLILTANNMFREWRVELKSQLKAGANQLLVVFPSPIAEARRVAAGDFWRQQTQTPEKSYLRKAAYEYGWDWGPRFVLSGIWRPVRLEVWDDAKISHFHVRQLDINSEMAHLVVETEITSAQGGAASLNIDYEYGSKKTTTSRDVELNPGVNHIDVSIDIAHPELWYPNGYGRQAVYAFHAQLKTSGHMQDDQTVRTGLRSIVLRRELDQWGRSFELVVNGIPVFAKGADVIPFDSFPTRVTIEQYRRVLESAKAANMNMIRHWGGGYYETDEFYALCDELGIMIWQDFMFGNEWQPGTYDFKQNVAQEAEYQILRLRDHPSIVLWCGNNETEASWDWHRDITSRLSTDTARRMWQDYLTIFSGVLASAVERLAPETPYWPSSPSADYEDISENHQAGDMHNWSVWHGMLPFRDYEKSIPRFMTEYGFQSFPEMRTVEAFTLAEDRTGILTPVMLAHQKNTSGNAKIHDYMLRDYPEPKDFASFLYASQVLQAEGIKIGTEHLRRNRPRTMGAIYWQLNDCWPVASWSSIDYYGRWKALQYYARRFYSDLLVSPHQENGGLAVYVVSDRTTPVAGELRLRVMAFDGHVLIEKKENVQIAPLASKIYLQLPIEESLIAKGIDPTKALVAAELTVAGSVVSSNVIYMAPTFEIHLPPAPLKTELAKGGDSYRLKVSSPVLARSVYISFGEVDAEVSDNYFDLLPGQTVEITIQSAASEDELRSGLKVVSLVDAFDQNAVAKAGAGSGVADPNWVK
ncbi:MAG: glycoside hydrolase family 2 protein [Candidatus Sulfotelmatobacter sp.]|jgi:beta-mannosidase